MTSATTVWQWRDGSRQSPEVWGENNKLMGAPPLSTAWKNRVLDVSESAGGSAEGLCACLSYDDGSLYSLSCHTPSAAAATSAAPTTSVDYVCAYPNPLFGAGSSGGAGWYDAGLKKNVLSDASQTYAFGRNDSYSNGTATATYS